VRAGRAGDIERLARRLLGREYVLVLGGGGARGLAHLGTYRALVEAGIPIDVVAGVSAGSLFAAGIAMDRSPDEAEELSLELLVDAGSLVDLTIPTVALSSGRRITERIQHAFGPETDMEDLWRPMFCVSADLTTLTAVVHRTGPLWRAIRATVGVPGVFPPLVEGEAVLVDGGVIDNLPVQRARRLYPRATIIASDVGRRHEQLRHNLPDDGIVPGWRSAWHRVVRRHRTPGLVTLLYRLTALGSGGDPGARGDIHIEHRLDGIGMFDFPKARPAIRAGYEQASAVLSATRLISDTLTS
jgi:NTE family protein